MIIKIVLNKKDPEHIKEHSFLDCCEIVDNIMRKVQREVKKRQTNEN